MSLRVFLFLFSALFAAATCHASAFLQDQGRGQFIAGVGYTEGSRRFDQRGHVVAAPMFRKADAFGYVEFGQTPWLSLIAAPTLSHEHDSPATNAVTGSDQSAFGVRYRLLAEGPWVVSVQALVQPPIGNVRRASYDLRLLYGRSFEAFGLSGFLDVEPGVRVRGGQDASEGKFDATFGLHLRPTFMLLIQTFTTIAPAGPVYASTSYTKGQLSAVYDVTSAWSIQAGVVRTLFGHNAVRETGPLFAVWYRF